MSDIYEILKCYWGYAGFRPLQEEIIRSVLEGKDTLALMPTGGGKSITYQVAALARPGLCLVVTPLIALMKDQVEDLKVRGIPAEAVYTGMEQEQMESVLNKCIYNGIKFLYLSPERLASERFRSRLKQMKVTMLAVDEAHCISQWGYDFRPSYLQIAEIRSFFPGAPVLALTATATPVVVEDIQRQLQFLVPHVLSKSFRRSNLSYVVRAVNDKTGELVHILSRLTSSAIVYVRKRSGAEQLAKFLCEKGIRADFYHAGLSSLLREKKQEEWKSDKTPVIVATNAFGMGIDKPDVRVVVHFDIPDSPEAYFQEAGRAGRDGKKAYAVLLCNPASVVALKARVSKEFPEKAYIKKVYEHLGDFFQIAEGAGNGYAFEFDAGNFIRTFKLDQARTFSALSVLEVGGYLECTTDINSRSRVCFTVSREQLNRFLPSDEFMERLLVILMRKYAGIFVQYVFINEKFISEEMGVERSRVYETLVELSRRKVLHYVPGNDRPYIIYRQPRLPVSYVNISKEAYEKRKKNYAEKVNKMVEYIENGGKCRQLFLMQYFGQKETEPCGICDLCLKRRKKGPDKTEVAEMIRQLLTERERPVKELIGELEKDMAEGREQIIGCIRFLLDKKVIFYRTPAVLAWNEKNEPESDPGFVAEK